MLQSPAAYSLVYRELKNLIEESEVFLRAGTLPWSVKPVLGIVIGIQHVAPALRRRLQPADGDRSDTIRACFINRYGLRSGTSV